MEPASLIEWALFVGLAVVIFNALTGFDDAIARFIYRAPTKKELIARVEQLEARLAALESTQSCDEKTP
ncbi:hypothetical protein LJ739_13270 [Aestuariibacter halophilus]|uniref:Uncharacterized protein n=1 Tax=Fluctibacter halophilus TaxID=226011 RepID=A0ABS8G9P6_9ALTE|nr:hypothetical protein [Aestuariibacter halophilus]MCC2617218.1 hypothetical protein [Aestuariibacter halophilus]